MCYILQWRTQNGHSWKVVTLRFSKFTLIICWPLMLSTLVILPILIMKKKWNLLLITYVKKENVMNKSVIKFEILLTKSVLEKLCFTHRNLRNNIKTHQISILEDFCCFVEVIKQEIILLIFHFHLKNQDKNYHRNNLLVI